MSDILVDEQNGFPSGRSLDRASVPSPIAIEILMVHNGEGQSSHVPVFCVNLELLEIISFTLKSNYYVYIAALSLQYICS